MVTHVQVGIGVRQLVELIDCVWYPLDIYEPE